MALGIAAVALAAVFVTAGLASPDPVRHSGSLPYVVLYDEPANKLEANLNQGDGQAFAALAQDPLLRRPEVFRKGAAEASYRAQRPLFGWLAWVGSLGQPSLVPFVLLALSFTGFVLLTLAVGSELAHRGAPPLGAIVVVMTPGALITLDWSGPDAMAAAAAVVALGSWVRGERRAGIAWMVVAGLLRESTLIVPVALGLHAVIIRREGLRAVAGLALPVLAYVGWVSIIGARLGAMPFEAGQGRLGAPFAGIGEADGSWDLETYASASVLMGLGVVALIVARRDPAAWIAGAFAVFGSFLGSAVWRQADDFGRVLLPAAAFGVIAVMSSLRPSAAPSARRRSAGVDGPS